MPSCHSTNDIGLQLIQKTDTIEGTVIISDEQTHGRGQRGNSWISEAGSNLMMSLILKPTFLKPSSHFSLNMVISLAVRATVVDLIPNALCQVKWPNDIYIGKKKIAGILIENTVRGESIDFSVIGVGLNVNQYDFGKLSATSLSSEQGEPIDIKHVFERLVMNIEAYYLKLKAGRVQEIQAEYLQHLLGYQKLLKFKSEYDFDGIIQSVDELGHLLVKVNGSVKKFDFKEIEFLL